MFNGADNLVSLKEKCMKDLRIDMLPFKEH